jgi:anti-anti-sigma factor
MFQACASQEAVRIAFDEQLDTAKCMEIEAAVRSAVDGANSSVVFDLTGVSFVSSSFLRLCVYAARQAKDHAFQIVNVEPSVKRVFKIAGLDAMLSEA